MASHTDGYDFMSTDAVSRSRRSTNPRTYHTKTKKKRKKRESKATNEQTILLKQILKELRILNSSFSKKNQ